MKKRSWWLGFALCMALTGCGARTAQETPVPQPSGTMETAAPTLEPTVLPSPTETVEPSATAEPTAAPTPAPLEDPKEYLLARLDQVMDGEEIFMRFWQHPGSGPSPVTLSVADHGAELRELFSSFDWEQVKESGYDYENEEEVANHPLNQPGFYSVNIADGDNWYAISCGKGIGVVSLGNKLGNSDSVYLRADGAEELCDRIADIVPSVYINLGRVRVPPQKTKEATIKLYLETALKQMKKNGHITDYVLRAYEPVVFEDDRWWVQPTEEPAWETHPGIAYTIAYAVKPAHPELSFWTDLDEDGWQNVDWRDWDYEYWESLDYDERDGCYGMY